VSATGFYQLTLRCDEAGCTTEQVYTEPLRAIAKEVARVDGWLIGKENDTYCPTHRIRPRKRAA
jgi:hypothetical protein